VLPTGGGGETEDGTIIFNYIYIYIYIFDYIRMRFAWGSAGSSATVIRTRSSLLSSSDSSVLTQKVCRAVCEVSSRLILCTHGHATLQNATDTGDEQRKLPQAVDCRMSPWTYRTQLWIYEPTQVEIWNDTRLVHSICILPTTFPHRVCALSQLFVLI